ncbi:uncharacterized protein LOC112843178 [Oreochromis niloticus]|uniref:uncharacterized protein LOC112843178 n=1 Tax=Oreochromis niloticus TaxID=8128 RepID=UPI000DF28705|nr:uncharacterized protein LOC112843178 [Oreochromis niloticus]
MYNRQTLLDLRLVASDLTNTTYTGHKTLPPFLAGIPANLCRTLAPASRRKRFRRRGKRSGLLVKLEAYLVRSSPAPWNKRGSVPHHVFSPRSLEPIDAWLVPVVASDQMSQPRKIFPHLRRRGANLQNLRPLCRVSQSATNTLTSTRIKKKRKTRRGRRAKLRRAAVSAATAAGPSGAAAGPSGAGAVTAAGPSGAGAVTAAGPSGAAAVTAAAPPGAAAAPPGAGAAGPRKYTVLE